MALNYLEKTSHKELFEQLRNTLNSTLVQRLIEKGFVENEIDIHDRIDNTLTPEELFEILKSLCWELEGGELNENYDENAYCYFSHKEYDFKLTMQFNGFKGTLKLYRSDI